METVQLISDKEKRYMSLTHEVFSIHLILIIFTEPSYSLVSLETWLKMLVGNTRNSIAYQLQRKALHDINTISVKRSAYSNKLVRHTSKY